MIVDTNCKPKHKTFHEYYKTLTIEEEIFDLGKFQAECLSVYDGG